MGVCEYAKERLGEAGFELVFADRPTFKEFAVRVGRPAKEAVRAARERGVHPGYALGRDYSGLDDALLIAITEKRTPEEIDRLADALAGVVYLSWLGKRGAVELAELMLRRADYARTALTALPGVRALHEQPVAREFALALEAPVEAVIERCAAEGVNPGLALEPHYPEHADGLLVAVTERRSRADIDRLADALGRAVAAERPARAGAGAVA